MFLFVSIVSANLFANPITQSIPLTREELANLSLINQFSKSAQDATERMFYLTFLNRLKLLYPDFKESTSWDAPLIEVSKSVGDMFNILYPKTPENFKARTIAKQIIMQANFAAYNAAFNYIRYIQSQFTSLTIDMPRQDLLVEIASKGATPVLQTIDQSYSFITF